MSGGKFTPVPFVCQENEVCTPLMNTEEQALVRENLLLCKKRMLIRKA